MSRVAIDTSLALKWELDEDLTLEARHQLDRWELASTALIVPAWFSCEVANALYQRCRKGDLTGPRAATHYNRILSFVRAWAHEPSLGIRAIEIAVQSNQKATYDSHYLALAEHLGCELWTADARFWRSTHGSFPFVNWLGNVVIVEPTA